MHSISNAILWVLNKKNVHKSESISQNPNGQFVSSILHTLDSCGNGGCQCIGAFDGLYSEFRITITEILISKGERLVDNEPKHKISMAICFDSKSIFFAVAALNIIGH